MPETDTAPIDLEAARHRVSALLRRDFPFLELRVGWRDDELERGAAHAIAVPASRIEAYQHRRMVGVFAVPADAWSGFAASERQRVTRDSVALVFREPDPVCRLLRRFYVHPVIFAGAGPGGLGSTTVDVARALRRADVVLADSLCGTDMLRTMAPEARTVFVGKRGDLPSTLQEEITERLVIEACRGRRVVRLKGGDPGVFGRLDEETGALGTRRLPYRVLAGVGAASGAAAYLGQPLTVRDVASEVILSTGRLAGGRANPFPLESDHPPTMALYMSRRILARRMSDLIDAGYPPETPVVALEKVGSPAVHWVTSTVAAAAEEVDRNGMGTPMIVLVGPRFRSPAHLPLLGIRTWLVAEEETALTQRDVLEELGASCVIQPLIETRPLPIDTDDLFERRFDWIAITSKKAVDYLFALLEARGLDARWFPRIAAIGEPAIAKLRARGLRVDLVPPEPTRRALARALVAAGVAGKRVLLPFSSLAPNHVTDVLRANGAVVSRVNLYTLDWTGRGSLPDCDVVLFSSESTVRSASDGGIVERLRGSDAVIGGIGPATCRALQEGGLRPEIVPLGTSPDALAFATRRYFARREIEKQLRTCARDGDGSP